MPLNAFEPGRAGASSDSRDARASGAAAQARAERAQARRAAARFEADLADCRAMIRTGSHSFYAASRLLPSRVRRPAFALYAFCRLADDAVDLAEDGRARGAGDAASGWAALERLRRRLDRVYAGRPCDAPADRAFAATAAYFALPRALPEALLEGFAWDLEGRRYETLADVEAYAARVAGSVGAMMCGLRGARAADRVARACDRGAAMQLTNIARDVGEDARAGRLYLPRAWLREEGVDPERWLARPVLTSGVARVTARLLDAADRLYRRSEAGIARLPADCRPAIYAARYIYAEIGAEIARAGFDSVSRRASTSTATKAMLIGRAVGASFRPARWDPAPPSPAMRFLVEAAALNAPFPVRRPGRPVWPPGLAQVDRVLDIFVRLAQDEAERRAAENAGPGGARAQRGGSSVAGDRAGGFSAG